jgi:hypothetical protein
LSNKTFSDLVKKIIHAALLTATSDARNGDDLSASMKRQNKIIQPIS